MGLAGPLLWGSSVLIAYAHAGYPLALWVLARLRPAAHPPPEPAQLPSVSLIVAAYDEQNVIERKVANVLALDYPRERLELIVASDGSADATATRARTAGADVVLDLPRAGKVRTQDAAVSRARGDVLAFSDANSTWEPDALRRLVAPLADPGVGYVCGQVVFVNERGSNQEDAYWRYEMAIRSLESRLGGVTAGNGAIYALPAAAYLVVDARMGHDLSLPFNIVKRGQRALYEPRARASEKMVPSIEGEFRRKRRMMSHAWPIVVRGGMLSPGGYTPLYAFQLASHRLLRYLTPALHVIALGSSAVLRRRGGGYALAWWGQLALVGAALLGGGEWAPRPLRLARYYVLVTASLAAGLWDWLRTGTPAGWEKPEGTR